VAALRLGVVDLLEKPYDQTELLDAIERCFLRCRARCFAAEGQDWIAALTPRERDALDGVMRGETSKHAARRLNLSPRTVEMHRARMMRKLGVKTATGIVAVAARAGYRVDHLLG
jgi:two-component system response regulator FixJ